MTASASQGSHPGQRQIQAPPAAPAPLHELHDGQRVQQHGALQRIRCSLLVLPVLLLRAAGARRSAAAARQCGAQPGAALARAQPAAEREGEGVVGQARQPAARPLAHQPLHGARHKLMPGTVPSSAGSLESVQLRIRT